MMHHRRTALFTLLVFFGLVGTGLLWLRARQRQYVLNRQLISALVKGDDAQALTLLEAGADPNTRYTAPSALPLIELVNQSLHRSPPPVPDSPTALVIACGGYFDAASFHAQQHYPDDALLVQTMLKHGAEVNPKRVRGGQYNQPSYMLNGTPLMWAVSLRRPKTIEVLLAHGATVSATGNDGQTALHFAIEIRLPQRTVQQLLTHGGDPNLADRYGITPLMLAQRAHRPDYISLLKRYGAKESKLP